MLQITGYVLIDRILQISSSRGRVLLGNMEIRRSLEGGREGWGRTVECHRGAAETLQRSAAVSQTDMIGNVTKPQVMSFGHKGKIRFVI